jgi:hypothetical protein
MRNLGRSNASPAQQWRWKRDLAIFALAELKFPHRFLADVFDLSPGRISPLVKKLRILRRSKRASVGLQRLAPLIWVMAHVEKVSASRARGKRARAHARSSSTLARPVRHDPDH